MTLERLVSKKRKWLRFGLKTLAGVLILAATPLLTFKYYEGKAWHPAAWGSLNPRASNYAIKKYASIWGSYGIKRFKSYKDYDRDGKVDEISTSTTYADWMNKIPFVGLHLPPHSSGESRLEVWARGPALKFYPDASVDLLHLSAGEKSLDYKAVFNEADAFFKKWYQNNEPMPYEPRDDERWALFSWLKERK